MLLFIVKWDCQVNLTRCKGTLANMSRILIVFQNEKGDNVLVTSVAKGEFYNEYQRIKKKNNLSQDGFANLFHVSRQTVSS